MGNSEEWLRQLTGFANFIFRAVSFSEFPIFQAPGFPFRQLQNEWRCKRYETLNIRQHRD
jgi:hypothetical protein